MRSYFVIILSQFTMTAWEQNVLITLTLFGILRIMDSHLRVGGRGYRIGVLFRFN